MKPVAPSQPDAAMVMPPEPVASATAPTMADSEPMSPAERALRERVLEVARSWLGTPYRHQGSLKGIAADCLGFIGGVGVECGFPSALAWSVDATLKGYGPRSNGDLLIRGAGKYLQPIPVGRVRVADILFMRWEDIDEEPSHFALISCLSPLNVIHAYSAARRPGARGGMVAEHHIDGFWRQGVTWRSRIVEPAWSYIEMQALTGNPAGSLAG